MTIEDITMKQVTAIFQPHRLEQIEQALHALPHLPGFTTHTARGHARGHGADHSHTPDEWAPDEHDKLVMLLYCADEHAPAVVAAIRQAAYTGVPGDGVIAISELVDLVRIRTGERGDAAV